MSIGLVTPETEFLEFRAGIGSEPKGRVEYEFATLDRGSRDRLKGNSSSDLSESLVRAISQIAHVRRHPEGTYIFLQGDIARGVYMLCAGRANVLAANIEGRTSILKFALPGDVLGLSSVLAGTSHEVTVEAVHPCELAFVTREDFLKLVKQNCDACLYFAQHLARDCSSAYDMIRSMGDPVTMRLARFLLASCVNGFVTEGIVRARLVCTHETIARRIGCSRETVSRTLRDFKRKGLAELVGTTLLVRDLTALERLTAG